jgi:hypothetical protein
MREKRGAGLLEMSFGFGVRCSESRSDATLLNLQYPL